MVVLAGGGDFWVRCVRLGSRVLEKTEEGGTIVAVEDTCFVVSNLTFAVKSSRANNAPDLGSMESLISKKRMMRCLTWSLTITG